MYQYRLGADLLESRSVEKDLILVDNNLSVKWRMVQLSNLMCQVVLQVEEKESLNYCGKSWARQTVVWPQTQKIQQSFPDELEDYVLPLNDKIPAFILA
ncbi:hypothetical protein BTVI_60715 [Pitangus sulphuratus]|nr:hypothetical protein BTVI_60715 [Pitangus sulphuratus]